MEARDALQVEGDRLIGGLKNAVIELDRLAPTSKTAAALAGLEITEIRDSFRATFPGLPDEFSLTIHVFDRSLSVLVEKLAAVAKRGTLQDIAWARSEIMNLASDPDAGPEHFLLAAYMLAMESKFDAALAELERAISKQRKETNKELFYLGAIINRRLLNGHQAKNWIDRALEIDPNDPRFCLEQGRILWLADQFATALGGIEPDLERLERAITSTQKAGTLAQNAKVGKEFLAQVHNSLAFFLAERAIIRNSYQDASAADSHVSQVREILDRREWISKFFDTEGWVKYARSKFATSEEKTELLTSAKCCVQEAIERDVLAGSRKRLLMLHQSRIEEALGACKCTN